MRHSRPNSVHMSGKKDMDPKSMKIIIPVAIAGAVVSFFVFGA